MGDDRKNQETEQKPDKNHGIEQTTKYFTYIISLVAVLSALFYVCGFIILRSYYNFLGITHINFTYDQYFIEGATFFYNTIIGLVPGIVVFVKIFVEECKDIQKLYYFLVLLVITIIIGGILLIKKDTLLKIVQKKSVNTYVLPIFFILLSCLYIIYVHIISENGINSIPREGILFTDLFKRYTCGIIYNNINHKSEQLLIEYYIIFFIVIFFTFLFLWINPVDKFKIVFKEKNKIIIKILLLLCILLYIFNITTLLMSYKFSKLLTYQLIKISLEKDIDADIRNISRNGRFALIGYYQDKLILFYPNSSLDKRVCFIENKNIKFTQLLKNEINIVNYKEYEVDNNVHC
ncbi:MAG: hypothetical protein HQK91_06975 [Nitrospirae bacterium]|nr:hypothetical protein [Nitrospirota bacterium]MBF0541176.1 hypothetical protein [Nitrospirota bacterium]